MTQHAEIVNVLSNHSAQLYSITKYGYPKQYKIHKISCTLCKNVPKCNPVPNPIYNKWLHKLSMTTIRSSLHLRYLFLLSFTLNHRLPGYFYHPVADCQFQTSPLHFLELKKVVGSYMWGFTILSGRSSSPLGIWRCWSSFLILSLSPIRLQQVRNSCTRERILYKWMM